MGTLGFGGFCTSPTSCLTGQVCVPRQRCPPRAWHPRRLCGPVGHSHSRLWVAASPLQFLLTLCQFFSRVTVSFLYHCCTAVGHHLPLILHAQPHMAPESSPSRLQDACPSFIDRNYHSPISRSLLQGDRNPAPCVCRVSAPCVLLGRQGRPWPCGLTSQQRQGSSPPCCSRELPRTRALPAGAGPLTSGCNVAAVYRAPGLCQASVSACEWERLASLTGAGATNPGPASRLWTATVFSEGPERTMDGLQSRHSCMVEPDWSLSSPSAIPSFLLCPQGLSTHLRCPSSQRVEYEVLALQCGFKVTLGFE